MTGNSGFDRRRPGCVVPALCLLLVVSGGSLMAEEAARGAGDPASGVNDRPGIPAGYMIVEGDIVVPLNFYETAGTEGTFAPNLWTGGIVPYEFDANVTAGEQAAMLVAMADWEAVSGADFRPRAGDPNYIHIKDDPGNWSFVGMTGGRQDMGIFNWNWEFIMAHELGHALGLWHEQSRPDRDAFVTIDLSNVCQNCCSGNPCDHNFNIVASSTAHGPYDYDSVMHYSACAFSVCGGCPNDGGCSNGGRTVIAPQPIGQLNHLSVGDQAVMAFLYGPASCGNGSLDPGEQCDPPGECCTTTCQYKSTGTSCGSSTNSDCTNPDSCNATGICMSNHAGNGTNCDDGLFCTDGETCASGTCGGGAAHDCGDGVGCTDDSCNEASNTCVHVTNGVSCDNNLWCDGPEFCSLVLDCQPGAAPCDDGIDCTTDPCDEFTQLCGQPVPHDALCDDGNVCNGVETCFPGTGDPLTGCLAGVAPVCDDGNPCTIDTCDSVTGCAHALEPAGTVCSNGMWCDGTETCDAGGNCLPGTSPCDDGILCTGDPCDDATDACLDHLRHDEECDDGEWCNGPEICDMVIGCVDGTPPNCTDGIDCTIDTCNEDIDVCEHAPNCGILDLTLHEDDGCFHSGEDFCVTIDVSSLDKQVMIGGQFFLEFNACLVSVEAIAPGDHLDPDADPGDPPGSNMDPCSHSGGSPYSVQIFENIVIDGCQGIIAFAVGVPLGGQGSAADNIMASIHFKSIVVGTPLSDLYPPALQGDGQIRFDLNHAPSTQLVDSLGAPDFPILGVPVDITVDDNAPIFVGCQDYPSHSDPGHCNDHGNPADLGCACAHLAVATDPGICTAFAGAIPCKVEDYGWCNEGMPGENDGCGLCELGCDPLLSDPGTCLEIVGLPDPFPSPGPYTVGEHCISWKAMDCAGNVQTYNQCITVTDEEAPTVHCLDDVVVDTQNGRCDAIVNPGTPPCEDNCNACSVVCTRDDGLDCFTDAYPLGTTTLTWCGTDDAGNQSCCEQTVTVNDGQDPVPTCPIDIVRPADPDTCEATIDPGMATCADNCSDPCVGCSVGCSRSDGLDCFTDPYQPGVTTLTWTCTDAASNSGSCEQTIEVNDEQLPGITCSVPVTVDSDENQCEAVVHYDPPVCTDNCPGVVCECDHANGSQFPVGLTDVCCTAIDASGNSDECCFPVIVNDHEAPIIACPGDIVGKAELGLCHAIVDIPDSIVTDNCPGTTWACQRDDTQPIDAPYPVGTTGICCTATDASGNTDECCFTVIIEDTEQPDITCPADIVVLKDPGLCEAVVPLPDPIVSDNCPGVTWVSTRSDSEPMDAPYPVGATSVCCAATDAAGNSNECCFTVTVIDDNDPTVDCPADID